ncbi:MAG: leucyl aminopeptidase [Rhizobiaceae bacterium]|nr:leucyl aminopeptidase [Rhizobiaceae bacterium]MCV0406458.1 leucyl aminopeptidase [Rhizobiaceae bacterium]
MSQKVQISFTKFGTPKAAVVAVLAAVGPAVGENARQCDPAGALTRAFGIAEFTGKLASDVDVLAPEGASHDRLLAIGVGKPTELGADALMKVGGALAAKTGRSADVALVAEIADFDLEPGQVADLALGFLLRSYAFDRYKTKKNDADDKKPEPKTRKLTIHCSNPTAARKAWQRAEAVGQGVALARDLVNEPANILGPLEFTAKARELEQLGVKVEILTEKEMKKLGMGALLGVAQGSARPPRMVIMQWNGGKPKDKPVAFVGKGVVFDSGGISIKPAGGMEDMKGDMGGAAAVTGLMHALAARKAKANVVGIIGLVENMVDGNAQRPGDIVTSMSGQTIEVLNTDAEGRLVLADALWYCRDRFDPRFMVNLATLTGAILIALGNQHAGLFSNNDELATRLSEAGVSTAERVWRMPLSPDYDRLIDSKNADMKNIGGRHAGSITAAQFLQRFVKDTPWAHLDVAGTAMGSPSNEYNQSWGSGWGVRLLDRLVADHYES